MRRMLHRPALGALAVVGALLLAGGVAYATVPDGNGVIHGCYATKDGSLRVIDPGAGQSCDTKRETALDWNQTGTQGPQGIQGPAGQRGPSDAWAVDGYDSSIYPLNPAHLIQLASVSLPAGNYFVAAQTVFHDPLGAELHCFLSDSGGTVQGVHTWDNAAEDSTLSAQSMVALASPDTVAFDCMTSGASTLAYNWKLDAIQIGTVH